MIFVAVWYEICGVILMGASGIALGWLIPAIYYDWKDKKKEMEQWIHREIRISYWTHKDHQGMIEFDYLRFRPIHDNSWIDHIEIDGGFFDGKDERK